uniref:Calmodulin n=1 Tax=Aplanochytrium stocchinoi TaxID=215587 RepID=A0A7S3PJ03_9STRA|mmetsp:Transcript_13720/g.17024  ORF Transcript_13720/g.17024 Transcript_13720/m.17024 type:complete len:200 (-) Transcript_13720:1746-2345(-)|eukprot:CAMPEP_0204832158 /NCGR_PEP_ID=MMETSP1346-20131115/12843_1 /ASSEMBLY_ACC=CAM_ASM_000771 /TAXON_ID=215587 /ORGANISM="Aplanochytrium stocchinoi, Strain GSBS06" /LENGTH=199 /DNA_ID=CAMNT_0051963799 /DNA_START=310 /DNA_END=909 /DNA_ORIENTATION=+
MSITPELKAQLKEKFHMEQEEIDNYASVFELFDEDGNGNIDIDELGRMVNKIQQGSSPPTRDELESMMASVDADKNGNIDFSEFVTLMTNRVKHDDPDKEIRDAFSSFDEDGSGAIDKSELKKVFAALGITIDDQGLADIISMADKNDDGEIDFEEFKEMYHMLGMKVKSAQSRVALDNQAKAAAIDNGEAKQSCCQIS